MIGYRGKRAIDVVLASTALVALLPVQAAVALVVRRKLGSPVLFVQERPGLRGEVFRLRKFRTMLPVDEAAGRVDDADRLTDFGRFLRSTSLDELPSLWNVVRGDMSLVGPRPLLVRYLDRYTPEQQRRHEVRPGITGWAQASGRNGLTWDEKFALDVAYVQQCSLALDLQIIGRTITTVLRRDGIAADDSATMHEFAGSKESI